MFIQTEETPNPNALKFLPGITVLEGAPVFFAKKEDAVEYNLASALFEVEDVEKIMLGEDFISITKTEEADWEILKPQVFSIILDFFTSGGVVEKHVENNEEVEPEDEISKEIQSIINEKIRPAVMQDGGNVIFKKFEDGVVYLKLQGACSGCPSAEVTLKDGIENMLQYYIPEVQRVERVEE